MNEALDKEALRLLKAFTNIEDRNTRTAIIAITEAAACGVAVKIEGDTSLDTLLPTEPTKFNN